MKFIFPKNYDFKNKLFGIIEYSTAILNVVWYAIVILISNIFFKKLQIKIFIFIILCFPLSLLSIFGFHGENIFYVFKYLFKYFLRQKLYFYSKDYKK